MKMRRSISLDIDFPEGYVLNRLETASARAGMYSTAVIRKGTSHGKVIGDVTDRGDGGGAWATVYGEEREPFREWLTHVPNLYEDEDWWNGWDEQLAASALLTELEVLRTLKSASRNAIPFMVGDAKAWEPDAIRKVNVKDEAQAREYLQQTYPDQRIRIWNPTEGWHEVT